MEEVVGSIPTRSTKIPALDNFDPRTMPWSRSQLCVAGDQHCSERLRESDVKCVVGRQVVAEFPNPPQKWCVRIAVDSQVHQVLQRFFRSGNRKTVHRNIAPQGLRYLRIKKMRGIQALSSRKHPAADAQAMRGLEQPLHCSRRVQNDQRASRSSRMTAAAGFGRFTRSRRSRRSRNSPSVGRSATSRISASRYSDSDIPAMAARALRLRCSESGTFLSWIIFDML